MFFSRGLKLGRLEKTQLLPTIKLAWLQPPAAFRIADHYTRKRRSHGVTTILQSIRRHDDNLRPEHLGLPATLQLLDKATGLSREFLEHERTALVNMSCESILKT